MTLDSIKQYIPLKKELVYLILPFFLLLILFPTVLLSEQTFITNPSDVLLIINSELSVVKNPLSLWNNQWLTGLPAYSDPLSDRFYPLFYPFFILTQNPFIINIIILLHLYIAYLCFYKLSGLMTKNPELRMLSGLFYIFSGAMLSRVFAGHLLLLFALAWIPLLYYAFFKIVWNHEVTVKNIVILASSLTLIFFTGALYYLVYCGLILFVFLAYYILTKQIRKGALIAVFGAFSISALIVSIKAIPIILVSGALTRIDAINPLADGGSFESNLASLIFGTPIDKVFGFYESMALIGIIPVVLIILALVFDREDRAVPAFFAIIVAFVWADGGQTLLSFIHLLPVLNNFRVAGRIFGALLPLLLLFAVCGAELLITTIKKGASFLLNPQQKRNIRWAMVVIILVVLCELPFKYVTPILSSLESSLSVLFVVILVGLIYFNRATLRNTVLLLIITNFVNWIVIVRRVYSYTLLNAVVTAVVIFVIVLTVLVFFNKKQFFSRLNTTNGICLFFMVGLVVVLIGSIGYLPISDPRLNSSPAIPLDEKIRSDNTDGHQIWVLENGWSIQHLDFTYWFVKYGIHPVHAYYGYYPKEAVSPTYNIGGITYYTSDYLIDTLSLENEKQNLPEVTFTVNNIPVYKPDHVLPNAFVVRNDRLIPSTLVKFTPDEVILTGQFLSGDIAVLKTSFFTGWKMNGLDAINTVNMVGAQIMNNTDTVTFRYDPFDVKIAGLLSGIGIIIVVIAIIKRQVIETYLSNPSESINPVKTSKRGKKK